MFKVGDIVIGTNEGLYRFTGLGSICRVLEVLGTTGMRVEVLTPKPQYAPPGTESQVEMRHFKLSGGAPSMQIEKLEVYTCQKETFSGPCGEVAEHRIKIPGLAVYLCGPHTQPYIKGSEILEAVKCQRCGQICKPGYRISRDSGRSFCNAACEELHIGREFTQQYASREA